MTRIEVLPTGEKVFYIDVGNIPTHEVDEYIRKSMRDVYDKNEKKHSYFIPVRPSKEDTFHIKAQWFFIGGSITCFILIIINALMT